MANTKWKTSAYVYITEANALGLVEYEKCSPLRTEGTSKNHS